MVLIILWRPDLTRLHTRILRGRLGLIGTPLQDTLFFSISEMSLDQNRNDTRTIWFPGLSLTKGGIEGEVKERGTETLSRERYHIGVGQSVNKKRPGSRKQAYNRVWRWLVCVAVWSAPSSSLRHGCCWRETDNLHVKYFRVQRHRAKVSTLLRRVQIERKRPRHSH
jgi:hypothetical protein